MERFVIGQRVIIIQDGSMAEIRDINYKRKDTMLYGLTRKTGSWTPEMYVNRNEITGDFSFWRGF